MEAYRDAKLAHPIDDKQPSPPPSPPAPRLQVQDRPAARYNWLHDLPYVLGLLLLGISVAVSAYGSRSDPSSLAFMLFSWVDLLCLVLCLRRFERLAPDGPPEEKARLKQAVWLLSTALVVAFGWRVSELMPTALAVLIWISAGCVAVGGFYGLVLYKEQIDETER
ncbi:unnamed protein product [Musa acuminata subsp. malaccensis]|uniref:(wild Malaysian banana) hypothetical protein n=1 Tax=Musa acuminata subsp. malaccensis TaxID=214687 RepID=A0A804JDB6_MUSAM|nr:PREDICTED: uncharacterized protein LOC103986982 [Musa acuminata subsp. malaccensis]CAG1845464.1 unnamed protein product [Musa acuminata subsp. malaccensis]